SNLNRITPPNRPQHSQSYTSVNLLASYDPPVVQGSGTTSTTYTYDLDGLLKDILRPDGLAVHRSYDTSGRLSTVQLPTGTITYGYSPTTGMLTSMSGPYGVTLTRSEEHTSELQSLAYLVCRLLLEKKKKPINVL